MRSPRRRTDAAPVLAPGAVHLWCCELDRVTDHTRCAALLDARESGRWRRLHFAADRDRFLASHAFLRTVLARYTHAAPQALEFAVGEHGKPSLCGASQPAFNLSHSGARALLAVSAPGGCVGVDLERWRPGRRFRALAARHFAMSEVQELGTHSDSAIESSFYRTWTLKEAYLKARGTGLVLPLDGFWFAVDARGGIALDARPEIDPSPGRWHCHAWELPEGFSAALVHERVAFAGVAPEPEWFEGELFGAWHRIARAPPLTGRT